jgi:hypothetical protein
MMPIKKFTQFQKSLDVIASFQCILVTHQTLEEIQESLEGLSKAIIAKHKESPDSNYVRIQNKTLLFVQSKTLDNLFTDHAQHSANVEPKKLATMDEMLRELNNYGGPSVSMAYENMNPSEITDITQAIQTIY